MLRAFLARKLAAGLGHHTVRRIPSVLRNMLGWAVDDGLLPANPAARLGRKLGLAESARLKQDAVRSMTREQRDRFMESARGHRLFPLFLTLERAGLRLGEGLALRVGDFDPAARCLRIERSLSFLTRKEKTPKAGICRTVDVSEQLAGVLGPLVAAKPSASLLFPSAKGTPLQHNNVAHAFKRLLTAAGLPTHFSPHCLPHTFARLMLEAAVDVSYVSQQMGHASIAITADLYGRGRRAPSRVDVLDS